jgi:two-component SAPR family response regulator
MNCYYTVRIIFSKLSDKEMTLRSVKTVHQFLPKPCSADTINYTIERTCRLQDLLKSEDLKKIVESSLAIQKGEGAY